MRAAFEHFEIGEAFGGALWPSGTLNALLYLLNALL